MKRVFNSLILMILSAVIAVPAIGGPVMADSTEAQETPLKAVAALVIKAPGLTDVNQPVTITVFNKRDRTAIAGALVYALNINDLVVTADKINYVNLLYDYEATAVSSGVLLGVTGDDGTVIGKLADTGRFILVATKTGYIPGFTRITVTLASVTALNIRAAGSTDVNRAVTFTITERYSGARVEGASVYARLITDNVTIKPAVIKSSIQANINNKAVKQKASTNINPQVTKKLLEWDGDNATVIRSYPWDETAAVNYAAEIQSVGFLLGTSDSEGRVTYTFTGEGSYILAAIKDQCIPGFARIKVRTATDNTGNANGKKRLVLKAPVSASTGQQVSIKAFLKTDGLPAENALIYAFRSRVPPVLKARPFPRITENGTATQVLAEASAEGEVNDQEVSKLLVQSFVQPVTLGMTDMNGEVLYTFNEAGAYTLTAVKDGCIPAGARINILPVQLQKSLAVNAAVSTAADQPSVIKVWEKSSSQPVSGAAVYVLKVNNLAAVKPMPSTARNTDSQGDQHRYTTANAGAASRLTAANGWIQNEADTARDRGTLAGYTDDSGRLLYNFTSSGQYIISAYMDGCKPGFTYVTFTLPISGTTGNPQ